MKKISILAAFLFVVLFSSSALAANWVQIEFERDKYSADEIYVDKDSIRRGVHSVQYDYKRPDGFSAHIRVDGEIYLFGFWIGDEGERRFAWLDKIDENGQPILHDSTMFSSFEIRADSWMDKAYYYIERNLP